MKKLELSQLKVPDYIEPLIGFREWYVWAGLLLSPYQGRVWNSGVNQAHCELHSAPQNGCECGLYAYPTPFSRLGAENLMEFTGPRPFRARGAVEMWGKVEIHNTGVRAEYMKPVALMLKPGFSKAYRQALSEVAIAYDLELIGYEELLSFKEDKWVSTGPSVS